ncbi:MAG: polysaccharide deacetylase family protein [Sediminibacterium sp.]
MYLIKAPFWIRWVYPQLLWRLPTQEKVIYLSFDDGPHESATDFVLDQLKAHGAKACFFCIGKNVVKQPEIYQRILDEGHQVGNHTQHHMNGWENSEDAYLQEVAAAAEHIHSPLFRPPYGRIKRAAISKVKAILNERYLGLGSSKIVMWDVLSGDFDTQISGETCFQNVVKHAGPGSIIVFHDSTKAWERMSYALPKVLQHFSALGYKFETIPTK